MKTLQIIDNLIPDSSEGRRVVTVANELCRKGHKVTVASAFKGEAHAKTVRHILNSGVEILWHYPVFRFSNYYYSPELYSLLCKGDYDVIHAHSYRHYGTYIGALLRKQRKTPLVVSPYGSAGYGSSRRLMPLYIIQDLITRNYPLRYADRILANTLYERDSLIDLGTDPDKIDVVYREVDTELFKKVDDVVDDIVLYVGRVTPIKGIELLVEAMSLLGSSFKLVIVGPIEDPGYYRRLRSMVRSQRLEDRVDFIGEIHYNNISYYLSQALVLVLPSRYENLGGVLLEAQACECPVIATNVGGMPEIINNGETGFIINRSHGLLAEKINLLFNDRNLRNRMGVNSRKYIQSFFSVEVYVDKILDAYNSVVYDSKPISGKSITK